jgi:hypothetical protein
MKELILKELSNRWHSLVFGKDHDLKERIGEIGHLRGDFGSSGGLFYTTFFDSCPELKTAAFKQEFDDVVNTLREGILKSRADMSKMCWGKTLLTGAYCEQYAFYFDTEQYAYLLRCIPVKGDYNFYLYAFVKEKLFSYIEESGADRKEVYNG